MPSTQEPFLAYAHQDDQRFPTKPFDPKAVTRASWEPRPQSPKKNGPLLSFNRHPDAQGPLSYRNGDYKVMSARTKQFIVWVRRILLGLRVIQLLAAAGVLVLMILITEVRSETSWLLRVLSGVAAAHCTYGIYHLSHAAGSRTPASSSAYHFFAAACDTCVPPIYAYGALAAQNSRTEWSTLLADKSLAQTLASAVYYAMIADSFVHAATLLMSVWLGIMFRKITLMPPDMNPLEGHLTARTRHKKAKSSNSTVYTDYSNGKRTSTAHDSNRGSVQGFDEAPRGPTVPFHHSRARESVSGSNRDSRLDLPSRGYQLTPTTSARSSTYSQTSNLDSTPLGRSPNRGSYVGVPLDDLDDTHAVSSPARPTSQPKPGKFTENWTTSESLISRTQQRHNALAAQERDRAGMTYDAITERYGGYGDSEEEEAGVNVDILAGSDFEDDPAERRAHADPLRSHPATPPRTKKAYRGNVLSEMGLDGRNVSGSADITDTAGKRASAPAVAGLQQQRYRNSSIQPEGDFLAKPYGDLRAATPPVIVGGGRQVSSGNDYEASSGGAFGRRNVSGKVAEEGQAGKAYSRFSMFG